jgi:hypothetical protein
MDLLAFRSQDDTRACASTCGRADCCPLLAAGNCADDRADPGAACDDACVTPLLGIRRSRIGVGRDWDRPVILDNLGERETDAGADLSLGPPLPNRQRVPEPAFLSGEASRHRSITASDRFAQKRSPAELVSNRPYRPGSPLTASRTESRLGFQHACRGSSTVALQQLERRPLPHRRRHPRP